MVISGLSRGFIGKKGDFNDCLERAESMVCDP